jgi:hypothetical protein
MSEVLCALRDMLVSYGEVLVPPNLQTGEDQLLALRISQALFMSGGLLHAQPEYAPYCG